MLCLLLSALAPLCLQAREYTDDKLHYSITIPDTWHVSPGDAPDMCLTASFDADNWVDIYAYRSGEQKHYSFIALNKNAASFALQGSTLISIWSPPFYDLLRNKIECVYQLDDGSYLKEVHFMRMRTLFVISAYAATGDFTRLDAVIRTLDIHPTLKGNFLRAKSNLGWFWSCVLLSLFPSLGSLASRYRKESRNLGIHRGWYITWLTLSALFVAATFFMLHADPLLACIVTLVVIALWSLFFFSGKFADKFYQALFG